MCSLSATHSPGVTTPIAFGMSFSRLLIGLGLAAGVFAACGDPTGLEPGVGLQLTGASTFLLFPVDLNGGGVGQECRLQLLAFLTGASVKDSATFVDLRFDYSLPNDTTTVRSDTVANRDLVAAVGKKLSSRDSLALQIWFISSGPF